MKTILAVITLLILCAQPWADTLELETKETLSVIEINKGDTVEYTLQNGRTVSLELLDCHVDIIFTTLDTLKKGSGQDCTVYSMTCHVKIDGQPMKMVRYVPVQESYYKPYTVNGLTIWFDALKDLSNYFNENHGSCVPAKDARFAFQDTTLQISPQKLSNWFPAPKNRIFINDAYRGDDCWLGTYFGADLHGGLDVNMPSNTPLIAPIDLDEHYFFNSLKNGDNNNRWRGIRYWDNGDIWYLQTHHMTELIIPPYQSITQGQTYGYAAGMWAGYSSHSHFVFKTYQAQRDSWIVVDPWIIHWQIFENNNAKSNAINAHIEPLAPAKTGETVHFGSRGSCPGIYGGEVEYFWNFGDGYTSIRENPIHIYQRPGIYPVTLTLRSGSSTASYTQHITINGKPVDGPSFEIKCDEEPSFYIAKNWKTAAYGSRATIPNTLHFKTYQESKNPFEAKTISILSNQLGRDGSYAPPHTIEVIYKHGSDWIDINKTEHDNCLDLSVKPIINKVIKEWGFYEAYIIIHHDKAINSPQYVRVKLDFSFDRPGSDVIVDNQDPDCVKSDYFWLATYFRVDVSDGYNGTYLMNASNQAGEYVRYTPNLREGTYNVSLHSPAYHHSRIKEKLGSFYAIVKHKDGLDRIRIEPNKSLDIGQFEFSDGKQGYVEIVSDDSDGLIIADAMKFSNIK